MVDVSGKVATLRRAVAEGFVKMAPATLVALRNNTGPKGEVVSVARIAGIQAAKRTGELIPLCHSLPVEQVTVEFELIPPDSVRIVATAVITAKTGIEMEAFTAVTVAALTIIDMLKAIDQRMQITGVRLLEKTGGKSDYRAAE
jgi:cyclic pyranopterin phosphate synthase